MFLHKILELISVKFLFVSILVTLSFVLQSQVTDSTYMFMLKTELSLDSTQSLKVDTIYSIATAALRATDKEVQSLSRKSLPQEEKDFLTSVLTEKKKSIKQDRENSLLRILSDQQSKAYFEKIKPSRPTVLHMGINHDRVNCNVCVKN